MVASEGFEPPKSETSDLQSDPFGRLGNLPGRLRPRGITWPNARDQEYKVAVLAVTTPAGKISEGLRRCRQCRVLTR